MHGPPDMARTLRGLTPMLLVLPIEERQPTPPAYSDRRRSVAARDG